MYVVKDTTYDTKEGGKIIHKLHANRKQRNRGDQRDYYRAEINKGLCRASWSFRGIVNRNTS